MTAGSDRQVTLGPAQLAEARSRSYTLLGRLYHHGLDAATLPAVRAIPALAETLPDHLDEDELAATHQHLFGFNVFPYQSLFLDPAGLLGGPVTTAVWRSFQQAGFAPPEAASASADHIGHELALLAFLAGAEADARADGLAGAAADLAGRQRAFLDEHLLRWLPPLTLAVQAQEQPFYSALADLTLALVMDQRAELGGTPADFELPAAPSLLDEESTGLKEIAAFLLTTPYSALYLSRDDIGRLARQQRLPRGFGQRRDMLLNLLRAAATYDRLPALLADLRSLAAEWQAAYGAISAAPAWQQRTEATARLLAEFGRQAQALTRSVD